MAAELTDQKKKLALAAGGLALFLFCNTNFYMPALSNIVKLRKELKNLKSESSRTGESFKTLCRFDDIDAKIKEMDSLYQGYMPNEKSVAQLITFLSKAAEKYKINLLSINPGDSMSQEVKVTDSDMKVEYWVIPVQVVIKATPKELANFLNEIAKQERLFSLRSIGMDYKDDGSEGYHVQIALNAYALNKITLPDDDFMTNIRFRQAEIDRILKAPRLSRVSGFSKEDFEMFKAAVLERPVATPNSGQSLGLTGIIFSPTKQLAVINGQLCREGDVVQGKKVIEIREKNVVFQDETKKYILEMGEK